MSLIKLFKISVFVPLIYIPLKIIVLYACGIIGIRKWGKIFDTIELITCSNRVSFWKTIYFNLRSLPVSQAFKFPIHVYTGIQLISTSGNIIIENCTITFGMIKWGWFHTYRSQGKTRIQNKGTIIFHGSGKIFMGSEIVTWPHAVLTIGHSFFIGENVLIYCSSSITMGESARVSYQSDISDSDFHYCIDLNKNIVSRKNAPIQIGAYNWIAARTTIKKGTITPDHIIVASSYAVLSKDYTKSVNPYSILGGCPAKVIKTDISRIWHNELANIARIDNLIGDKQFIDIPTDEVQELIQL